MPEITLLKPHTHKQQPHPAGASIEVSASDAAWMIRHGIGACPDQTSTKKRGRVDNSQPDSDLTNDGETNG